MHQNKIEKLNFILSKFFTPVTYLLICSLIDLPFQCLLSTYYVLSIEPGYEGGNKNSNKGYHFFSGYFVLDTIVNTSDMLNHLKALPSIAAAFCISTMRN